MAYRRGEIHESSNHMSRKQGLDSVNIDVEQTAKRPELIFNQP